MENGTRTGSRSVSCVSDVYNNTAQAGLHTEGPCHKHEWSPVLDQTDPPGGNPIWNILSKGKSSEEEAHNLGGWEAHEEPRKKTEGSGDDDKTTRTQNQVYYLRPSSNLCFFSVTLAVGPSDGRSATEIPQKVFDGLLWNFVQTLMVPRGRIWITLVVLTFLLTPPWGSRFWFEWNVYV